MNADQNAANRAARFRFPARIAWRRCWEWVGATMWAMAGWGVVVLAHPGHEPQNPPPTTEAVAVVFADFHVPDCAQVNALLDQLATARHLQLQKVFKHAPTHPEAWPAHEAALAAAAQGYFFPMCDALFNEGKASGESLTRLAQNLGLDRERFERALTQRQFEPALRRDITEAKAIGVTKLPTVFFNGIRLEGIEELRAAVRRASLSATESAEAGKLATPPGGP